MTMDAQWSGADAHWNTVDTGRGYTLVLPDGFSAKDDTVEGVFKYVFSQDSLLVTVRVLAFDEPVGQAAFGSWHTLKAVHLVPKWAAQLSPDSHNLRTPSIGPNRVAYDKPEGEVDLQCSLDTLLAANQSLLLEVCASVPPGYMSRFVDGLRARVGQAQPSTEFLDTGLEDEVQAKLEALSKGLSGEAQKRAKDKAAGWVGRRKSTCITGDYPSVIEHCLVEFSKQGIKSNFVLRAAEVSTATIDDDSDTEDEDSADAPAGFVKIPLDTRSSR